MVSPPFACRRSTSHRSTALFHAWRIAREGLRLAPIRDPKFELNLPAVIKRQCSLTAPGSSIVKGGSCGASVLYLGPPAFNRSLCTTSTPEWSSRGHAGKVNPTAAFRPKPLGVFGLLLGPLPAIFRRRAIAVEQPSALRIRAEAVAS
jgi:hypothetical protein